MIQKQLPIFIILLTIISAMLCSCQNTEKEVFVENPENLFDLHLEVSSINETTDYEDYSTKVAIKCILRNRSDVYISAFRTIEIKNELIYIPSCFVEDGGDYAYSPNSTHEFYFVIYIKNDTKDIGKIVENQNIKFGYDAQNSEQLNTMEYNKYVFETKDFSYDVFGENNIKD
jgi:hypothetical protein